MSYFQRHYSLFSYPIETDTSPGFRPPQIAAIQAVNAHLYSKHNEPGIVTMPTGSGKTTIINALCFTQRAKRVLVITPSRLVREQIAEGFETLEDLIKIGALPQSISKPKVLATDSRIQAITDWQALYDYDVVVATVPSINSHVEGAVPIPSDLFDIVLVDEAHHAPARTWSRVLQLCSSAKQVLFTATPFRRDEKEIKGRLVFSYDLRRAHEDGVFGEIQFVPVVSDMATTSNDIVIAKAAEAQFLKDRKKGLSHLLMVRTDSIKRAQMLKKEIYDKHTNLNLPLVTGKQSLSQVKATVEKLRRGELDGIICVNMFGEGFNLPQLKIAAIHSPHKSLAVTLQFIGRFARTTAPNIGQATFLTSSQESSTELEGLYESGAIWKDIISNLSASRITDESKLRDILESFEIDSHPDLEDVSIHSLAPFFHVKVFSTSEAIDMSAIPGFPKSLELVFKGKSDEHEAAIYITREIIRCPWSKDQTFTNVAYDLFIFHYNKEAKLLFICSSRRTASLYEELATPILNGPPQELAHCEINRALNQLEAAEFFSVGLRKRNQLGQTETYRMLAGPSADRSIQETDAILYDRGHCFGKGLIDHKEVTLGVSSASKIWSNKHGRIHQLLEWCDQLAKRINSGKDPKTGSRLDHLSVGKKISALPDGIIAMVLSRGTYISPVILEYTDEDGVVTQTSILDCDCSIVESKKGSTVFSLSCDAFTWHGVFSIEGAFIKPLSQNEPKVSLFVSGESISSFLNNELPSFYCQDMSAIEGATIYHSRDNQSLLTSDRFEAIDWCDVDITREKPDGEKEKRSIFEWLEERLVLSDASVVFCDDGSGEMADYISITEIKDTIRVQLFHCKASGSENPGKRVDDLYVVCGQSIKSLIWLRQERLLKRIEDRAGFKAEGFAKGDLDSPPKVDPIKTRECDHNIMGTFC